MSDLRVALGVRKMWKVAILKEVTRAYVDEGKIVMECRPTGNFIHWKCQACGTRLVARQGSPPVCRCGSCSP